MSEYTTRKILDMIDANEGPKDLDLAGKHLSLIDLSCERVLKELDRLHKLDPGKDTHWWYCVMGTLALICKGPTCMMLT